MGTLAKAGTFDVKYTATDNDGDQYSVVFGFVVRTVRNTIILESELVRTGFESAVEQYNALRRDVLYNHQHFSQGFESSEHSVASPVV